MTPHANGNGNANRNRNGNRNRTATRPSRTAARRRTPSRTHANRPAPDKPQTSPGERRPVSTSVGSVRLAGDRGVSPRGRPSPHPEAFPSEPCTARTSPNMAPIPPCIAPSPFRRAPEPPSPRAAEPPSPERTGNGTVEEARHLRRVLGRRRAAGGNHLLTSSRRTGGPTDSKGRPETPGRPLLSKTDMPSACR